MASFPTFARSLLLVGMLGTGCGGATFQDSGSGGSGGMSGASGHAGSAGAGTAGSAGAGTAGYGTSGYAGAGTAGYGTSGYAGAGTAGYAGDIGIAGSATTDCSTLVAQAGAALGAARQCNPAVSSLQCTQVVADLCSCTVSVNASASAALQAYAGLQKQLAAAGCAVGCPDILCAVITGGSCLVNASSPTGGLCVGNGPVTP